MKIYIASSWRNERYPDVVAALRNAGHEVYDFRHPEPGNNGFQWQHVGPSPDAPRAKEFRSMLRHPAATEGFYLDRDALDSCDACLLVLPCGASAHLEAGYAIGRGKPTAILLDANPRPELMYKLATWILATFEELFAWAYEMGGDKPHGTA